jgi:hypothetical protein
VRQKPEVFQVHRQKIFGMSTSQRQTSLALTWLQRRNTADSRMIDE